MARITDMRSDLNDERGGSSSHHLQGAGAFCGGPTAGRTALLFRFIYLGRSVKQPSTGRNVEWSQRGGIAVGSKSSRTS